MTAEDQIIKNTLGIKVMEDRFGSMEMEAAKVIEVLEASTQADHMKHRSLS